MIGELVILFNVLWLYCVFVPILLSIAFILIKIAKNSNYSLEVPHKHNFDYHSIKLEKILLGETDINTTYEIRDTYKCNDCEETEMLSHEVTYGK